MNDLGNRIRLLRKRLNLKQTEFANSLSISQSHLSKIESGTENMSDSVIKLISYEFGANEEWIKSGTGEMFKTASSLREFEEALSTIDDMVDTIAKIIISIAQSNDDFICTECLNTANKLYRLLRKYAREEDAERVRNEFREITGRDIDG